MRPIALALAALTLAAQPIPEFEVVSIKPARVSNSAIAIGTQSAPNTLTLIGIKLRDLIARAYSLQPYQIAGPQSLDEEYFDIAAKLPGPTPDAQQSLMLRAMLADRFSVVAHTETKDLPVYQMVVSRDGSKLKPTPAGDPLPSRSYPGPPTRVRANKITLRRLAELLTPKTDRPVIDTTGLAGNFDIELTWGNDAEPAAGPSLFTPIQEQLGLRLEAGRSPVEILVVDRIGKPSGN